MPQLQRLTIALNQIENQQIFLTEQQHHYLIRVLRLKPGEQFIAIDGKENWWLAQLSTPPHQAEIIESLCVQTELPISVTLMIALPKGNGFDEVVRQTTELGVTCITPIISDRTLLNPSNQKLERWRRIAKEAAEQSERQTIPTILAPVSLTTGLSLLLPETQSQYICVARGDSPHLLDCLLLNSSLLSSVVIAIGPEGGWSDIEIKQAIDAGFQRVSLGKRILRAVTAPIVALSLVSATLENRK